MKTEELINNSFMVLAFDSSAILQALRLKKKIISIRSNLFFQGKKYNSDLYAERVGLKTINIDEDIKFDKKQLIKELEKNVGKYEHYLNKYSSKNISMSGSKQIISIIKKRYF